MSLRGQVMMYGGPPDPTESPRGVPWVEPQTYPAAGIGALLTPPPPRSARFSAWWDGKTLRLKVTVDGVQVAEVEADGPNVSAGVVL